MGWTATQMVVFGLSIVAVVALVWLASKKKTA
jgi:hypothetical protein